MNPDDVEILIASNDPMLEPLIRARSAETRDREIEILLVDYARPLAEKVISRYRREGSPLRDSDFDDIHGAVSLGLLTKLRAVADGSQDAIRSFPNYLATLVYNNVYDILRRRCPERARLKNRIRYVLRRDDRLATWTTSQGPAAGLAEWGESERVWDGDPDPWFEPTAAMRNEREPGRALFEILRVLRRPVTLETLVRFTAQIWQITHSADSMISPGTVPTVAARYESRDYVRALWKEVQLLPQRQRAALLLNLREHETVNVVSLFVLTGIASFEELASAIGIRPARLAELWNQLPLDDNAIGSMLGVKRQQVINLRKSGRERLARRLASKRS